MIPVETPSKYHKYVNVPLPPDPAAESVPGEAPEQILGEPPDNTGVPFAGYTAIGPETLLGKLQPLVATQ